MCAIIVPKKRVLNEQKLIESIFYYSNEGIIVCKDYTEIVLANPCALKMFGYDSSEVIGMNIDHLVPHEKREYHKNIRKEYAHRPTARPMGKNIILYALRKDNSLFPVEISLSPFEINGTKYVVCFIVDITERMKTEEKLKEYTELLKKKNEEISYLNQVLESKVKERTRELARVVYELSQSKNELSQALEKEKTLNEIKSRFVSTASHEFRTPLGTILSSASLVQRYTKTEEQEKREKHIQKIKNAVAHLTEILNDFLSLDKLEEGIVRYKPSLIDIAETLKQIVDEITPILKKGQHIIYKHLSESTQCIADTQILTNILFNLISNASKYSEEDKPIVIISKIENNTLVISVKDEGCGIPEPDQQFLFTRFFRAENVSNIQGTGLGLNIVKKYIELMNGHIEFQSQLNKGSTFTIYIPFQIKENKNL
ncbi:MAG: PAS domain-containing sensor histidine kinase [Bacteroidia bacterium]|nr:PAS domain-containing sensor histidine kinase [Bacteroidia bacterium]